MKYYGGLASPKNIAAVDTMKYEAERFIERLDELRQLQVKLLKDEGEYYGTYQFKERAAVGRASIDLKRCMTENIEKIYKD